MRPLQAVEELSRVRKRSLNRRHCALEVADEPARRTDNNPSATAGGVILVVSFP
jgi:hypothetical protein